MGIDLDITKFIRDSDERAFRPIDEKEDREHIETRHQSMSCKEHESNNCQEARRRSARAYERLSNKRDAYHEALHRSYKSIRCRVSRSPEREQHDTAEREQSEHRGDVVVRDASSVQTHGKKNGCHVAFAPPVERRRDVCSVVSSRRSRCGCTSTRAHRAGLRWILTRTLHWRYSVLGYSNWGWEWEWLRMSQD